MHEMHVNGTFIQHNRHPAQDSVDIYGTHVKNFMNMLFKPSDWSLIIGGSYDIAGVLSGSWDFVDPSVLDPWPTLVAHAAAVKACPLVVEHGQL